MIVLDIGGVVAVKYLLLLCLAKQLCGAVLGGNF